VLHVPKKVPLNWYRYDVRLSVELLRGYLQAVEDQIDKSIENYRRSYEIQAREIEARLSNYLGTICFTPSKYLIGSFRNLTS
jgi:hypothetical protein